MAVAAEKVARGLPGRAGAVLPQVREGAGWREGIHPSGDGSCTEHVANHTLITCLVMHRSRDKS